MPNQVPAMFSMGRPDSALTHAKSVRLPFADRECAGRLRRAVTEWWPDLDEPATFAPVVAEAVPAKAESAQGRRRLAIELHRPLGRDGAALRCVLLRYSCGTADLVLVARRNCFDSTALSLVAEIGRGRLDARDVRPLSPERLLPSEVGAIGVAPEFSGRLEWTQPSARTAEARHRENAVIELRGEASDVPAWLAVAASIVLSRFERLDSPAVAVLTQCVNRPPHAVSALAEMRLLALDVTGTRSCADLLKLSSSALAEGPACDQATFTQLCPSPSQKVAVGILADCSVRTSVGTEDAYLACQTPPFPITLALRNVPHGQDFLEVHHRPEDADPESALRFAQCVAYVFEQLCSRAGSTDPLALVLHDEQTQRLEAARGRSSAVPTAARARIEQVFERHAVERPDAIAITCEGRSTSYAELDAIAERLAAGLRELGVKPGEQVGICLDRSVELVASMIAVLKVGAVYVPLDAKYPADRLAYTIGDAGLRVVVTASDPVPRRAPVTLITPAELELRGERAANSPRAIGDAAADAYIIYTSGSTGRPKGVVVPHENVLALIETTREDFAFSPADSWTLFHSSAFDFSVWEIWGPLLTGARLVVVPYWASRSPEEFHRLLADEQITVLSQTPSAFSQLIVADARSEAALRLRLVVFGGEPLDTRTLLVWFDAHPESECRLVNMFGITETTVHVTAQTITRAHALSASRSVGRPLNGWHVYVLDEHRRPAPCGMAGEIYVAGAGVARHYLGRAELTAEKFVADPFFGGTMYRSGDLGRLLPDGTLEHLGRIDNQVKVRGFRIELDEIRNVLLDDPAVVAAAVVLGGDRSKGAAGVRIDAYVVADRDTIDSSAARLRAAKLLPDFMVPATVTVLERLPLTANGKLDRVKLPEPSIAHVPAVRSSSLEPSCDISTPGEGKGAADLRASLAEVWQAVLGVPVGLDDNFFALGGNSLFAVQLGAAMRERNLPALAMRQLYLNPTVRTLSDTISST